MNFGIAIETDIEAEKKSALIHRLSDFVHDFLKDKTYGEAIENIHIGFICQRSVPGFEAFSKKRKPKYISSEFIQLLNGDCQEIRNTYTFDIKLDAESYDLFISASEAEALKLLIKILIESLSNFDSLPKKVKNFDVEAFKLALTKYLLELVD